MKLDREDFTKLAGIISDAMKEHAGDIAQRTAENLVHTYLRHEMREAIDTALNKAVRDKVQRYLNVTVELRDPA